LVVGDVYSRAVEKAAEVLGGAAQLAARLGLSVGTVRMLMGGKLEVPTRIFLLAVDIISAQDTPVDKLPARSDRLRSGD
jgi:hypothetical protein